MTPIELTTLIENLRIIGTDIYRYEVKTSIGKTIVETLSAFSNGNGGHIIVGLEEKTNFSPAHNFNAKQCQDQLTSFGAQLTPRVRPEIDLIPFEGSTLLVAYIPPMLSDSKPCYVTERGRYGGSYIRTGDGDSKLERYEVDRLIEEKHQPTWDKTPVPNATVDDLEDPQLNAFLDFHRHNRPKTFADGRDTALKRLGVTNNGEITLAALLCFGSYPQEFFPRLTVTYAEFPSSTRGSIAEGERLVDKATFYGNIPELVSSVVSKIQSATRTAAFIDGTFRYDLPDYPIVAVREAITNSLMHRDYSPESLGTPVQVSLFPDRLEIFNPGGLYGANTLHAIKNNQVVNSTRNQFLASLLENTPSSEGGIVAENRGTGIQAINTALSNALMPPPDFRSNLTGFTVIFYLRRLAPKEKHPVVSDRILEYLSTVNSASTTELVEHLRVSRSAIQKAVTALIEDEVIIATAPVRSPKRRYRLVIPK